MLLSIPTLAINIPVKALKLHHAEAAPGDLRPVFDHHGRFSNMDSPRRSLPQIRPVAKKIIKVLTKIALCRWVIRNIFFSCLQ